MSDADIEMRIAYLSSSFVPGRSANSVHVMRMCQALASLGHQVSLVAMNGDRREPEVSDAYRFYDVEPAFDLLRLDRPRGISGLPSYALHATLASRRIGADLVYARDVVTACLMRAFHRRIVVEAHRPIADMNLARRLALARLIRSPRLRRLVVISERLAEYYRVRFPALGDRILVAHDGADAPAQASPETGEPSAAESLRVGYVGSLHEGKGGELLVPLVQRCSWAHFDIVGGPEKAARELEQTLKGARNARVHGFLPFAQAEHLRLSCDVLIAPYQHRVRVQGNRADIANWMSPLKLFEYMAAGKAIVASDLPVLREVLTHEGNALLCDPADIEAWCLTLARLRDDALLRRSLGQQALVDLTTHYTWQARARRVLADLG